MDQWIHKRLTIQVIGWFRMSKHSFNKKIGIGSSKQDFVGLCIIISHSSSSETTEKVLNLGGITIGLSIEDEEESGNAEGILDILSKK